MTPDKLQEWPKVVVRPNVTLSHHRLWISHPPTHITSRRLMPGQHTAVCFRMSEFQTPYLFLCAVSLLHIPVDDLRNNGEKRIQLDLVSANAYLSPTPRKGLSEVVVFVGCFRHVDDRCQIVEMKSILARGCLRQWLRFYGIEQ